MKENELRNHATCANCHKKVLEDGIPLFWRVTIERFGIDINAVRRQQGLTMMLGGNAVIAAAMGPNEDMAMPFMEPTIVTLCEACGSGKTVNICALSDISDSSEN